MKKSLTIMMAAVLLTAAVPVIAAEEAQQQEQCAISAHTCMNMANLLEKRIKKLEAGLKRCSIKASPEDMIKLEQKLQDALDQLDKVEGKQ